MFKLAERRGHGDGPYCGPEGLYLGSSPLIARVGGSYRVRAANKIAALLAAAYGPGSDAARLLPRLRLAAASLQQGDIARAMIAAVHLRLGEIPESRLARLARAESLLKYNFDPNEPRVPAGNPDGGQWTSEGGGDAETGDATGEGGSDGGAEGSSGGGAGDTASGNDTGSGMEGQGSPGTQVASNERVWEGFPNAEFRNQLAIAELTADKANFGYTEARRSPDGKFALGRYQMTQPGLQAAGMMDARGNWTGKYGIYSADQFLASPEAQERALTDLLNDTERQLRANGSFSYIGTTIDGIVASFTVTRAGLIAAGHRYGPRETRDYLDEEARNGFSSTRARLTPADRAVETRLRTFAGARYD